MAGSIAAAVAATVVTANAYAQNMPEPREFPGVNRGMPVRNLSMSPDNVVRWAECTDRNCTFDHLQLEAPDLGITEDGLITGSIESQDPPTTRYGKRVLTTEGGNTFVQQDGDQIFKNGEPWFDLTGAGGVWSVNQYPGGRLAIALTRDGEQRGSADIFLIDEDTPSGSFTDFWNVAVPLRDINRTDRNELGIAVFPGRGEAFVSVQQLREGAVDMFDTITSPDLIAYSADRSVYDPEHRWINPNFASALNDSAAFEMSPSCVEKVLIDDATGDRTLASCLSFLRSSTALYSCVYMPAPPADDDHDLTPEAEDNCPGVSNRDQADWDEDGLGDACDTDSDNDGRNDSNDPCPQNF
ncbi:MAG: thrombospondin type 3 repeat-containing protein, partial [Patescibacteria group bacterium]